MAGNGVVLKPDNKTALSPLYGVSLLYEAGLPEGLFQVVCGEGPDVGPTLIDNANYVMFTGSTATGRFIGERAGQNLIGCCLELGGKNPMIVLADANLDEIVHGCAVRRVRQHRPDLHAHRADVRPRLDLRRVHATGSSRPPRRSSSVRRTTSSRRWARWSRSTRRTGSPSHVEDAVAKGATVLTGGRERPDLGPAFYEPTILEGVTKDMLAGVVRDLRPGRRAAPLRHRRRGRRAGQRHRLRPQRQRLGRPTSRRRPTVGRRIESGNVNVNDILATAYASKGTPSGGVKQSGVGARHGDQGLLKYTDVHQPRGAQEAGARRPPPTSPSRSTSSRRSRGWR